MLFRSEMEGTVFFFFFFPPFLAKRLQRQAKPSPGMYHTARSNLTVRLARYRVPAGPKISSPNLSPRPPTTMHPTAGVRPQFFLLLRPHLPRATFPFAAHYSYIPRPATGEELEKWRLRLRRRIRTPPPFSFPHYHIPFSPNLDPETNTATVDGPLPYYVHRTPTGNLPVYQEIRSGGNRHQTRIRRVEGDLQFLIRQIHEALELDKKDIIFNSLTSQVIIKGREKERVLELFKYLRF